MPFEEGNSLGVGRPKGSLNKKTILRAAFYLADKGISPIEKLVEIADAVGTPLETRVSLWKFLQSHVEAPQTAPTLHTSDSPEASVENARKVAEHLASLSRPLEPATTPKP